MAKKSRRNKADKPKRRRVQFVDRPFADLPWEANLVAMREIIPSATLPLRTTAEYGAVEFTLATLLPNMAAAMRRSDDALFVGAQTVMSSGDESRDLADRILQALELETGQTLSQADLPEPGPRLQDILDLEFETAMQLHADFEYWFTPAEAADPNVREMVEQSRQQIIPTIEVAGIPGAYWCRIQREFLRWVRPEGEDAVLDALARLQARRELNFDEARFVGAFRARGLLIPVFELQPGTEVDELEKPLSEFEPIFAAEIANTEPLTAEERRARSGIISRQVTLR
ncbi:MAG: DUF5926 family protein [Trueperella sp.]|nr:DUF5926 family protein [Trueperella sp.]